MPSGIKVTQFDGPRFSLVIPAYQAQSTLAETLASILAQSWSDWECIVVDDGSTDDTGQIAARFAKSDGRFRAVRQLNQGTAGAYNTGVAEATGRFVVICSADDVLLPEHLQRMAAFAESESSYDIYSTDGYFWWPDGTRDLVAQTPVTDGVLSWSLTDLIGRCFYSVGAAYRRGLFADLGGYRIGVFGEDYDFWLRAMASGARHRYLPEALSLHRVTAHRKSADVERAYRSDIAILTDLRSRHSLSPDERRAIDHSIVVRHGLIAQAKSPVARLKQRARVVLGLRRARTLGRLIRLVTLQPRTK